MEWNFDMDTAPKGHIVERDVVIDGKARTLKRFVPIKILTASACGKVIPTAWLQKQKRWEMYTQNELPIAWCELPKHPSEENKQYE